MKVWTKIENKIRAFFKKRGYTCNACGKEIFDAPLRRICDECQAKFQRAKRVCEKCGRATRADGICLTCKSHLPIFLKGFSPFVYKGEMASLVNRLKNGNRRLAFFLGEEMAKTLINELPDGNLLLVPVPLTNARLQERGYNQAIELAYAVYDYLQTIGYNAELCLTALEKRKDVEGQKYLGFTDRAKNAFGAYHLHERKIFSQQTVVVIDDILTTGATGSECARLLYGANAKNVYLLTASALPEQ